MKQIFKMTLIAVLGGTLTLAGYKTFLETPQLAETQSEQPKVQFTNYTSSPSVPLESIDFVKASKMSVDAVVHVKTTFQAKQYYNPWSQFFGKEPYQTHQQRAAGSGVIISDDGYIVTNNHVVQNAAEIEISTNNNRTYKAKVIGSDPATDLALLKIDEKNLPSIVLGDSDYLQVGEWVIAVGNPFNLTSTVTAGIVSAKARNINILDYNPGEDVFPLESFIQTDAAVNPGNSGGALVNGRGELVGINTAIASKTGSYSGYSFAVPVSIVKKVTADLLEFGSVQRAYIGVNISNINDSEMGVDYQGATQGAMVRGLMEDGAAYEAGLEEGDIIVNVEGIAVNNVTQLQEQVGKYRPGDHISVEVIRDKKRKTFDVLLRDRYGNTEMTKLEEKDLNSIFGAKLAPLSDEEKKRLNIENGVKIAQIGSGKLKQIGLSEGFVITHIDKEPVSEPKEVRQILQNKRGGVLVEGVHHNGMPDYYGFGL
ncbi:MAG: trypsin-like peptidase domain-containing protein [Flavobacteriales bacterium]|nr:trypsin-like peptidase domain-containing protein [Flavobacteriales bacterium]